MRFPAQPELGTSIEPEEDRGPHIGSTSGLLVDLPDLHVYISSGRYFFDTSKYNLRQGGKLRIVYEQLAGHDDRIGQSCFGFGIACVYAVLRDRYKGTKLHSKTRVTIEAAAMRLVLYVQVQKELSDLSL